LCFAFFGLMQQAARHAAQFVVARPASRRQALRSFQGGQYFGGPFGGAVQNKKFYEVLEVDSTANDDEIKKAYKKAVMKHHPDRNGDAEKFKEVSRAYEILGDPEKRRVYDAYGEQGLANMEGGAAEQADPFDLLNRVFGGAAPRGPPRTQDVHRGLELSLSDLYHGVKRRVQFRRAASCSACKGFGGTQTKRCAPCQGTGYTVMMRQVGPFVQQVHQTCAECSGQGFTIPKGSRCQPCKGTGTVNDRQSFDVEIPPGAVNGHEIRFTGMAHEERGHDTGDLVLTVVETKHPFLTRVGSNLLFDKTLPLLEALTGFEFELQHVSGEKVVIRGEQGKVVKPGDLWVISGLGMPDSRTSRNGDLFIKFSVEFPETLPGDTEGDVDVRAALSSVLPGTAKLEQSSQDAEKIARKAEERDVRRLQSSWQQQQQQGQQFQQADCAQS